MAQLAVSIVSQRRRVQTRDGADAARLRACRSASSTNAAAVTRRSRRRTSSTSAPTPRRGWRPSSGSAPRTRRWRSSRSPATAEPDLILQAMRAGANEFFPWTAAAGVARNTEESFQGAVRKTAARRDAATRRRPAAVRDPRLPRRQGRRRHDDRRGELRGRAGAADQAADRDPRPQALPRRGCAVPRRPPPLHACSTRSRICTGSTGSSCAS